MYIGDIVVLVCVVSFPSYSSHFKILTKLKERNRNHAQNQQWHYHVIATFNRKEL